MKTLFIPTGAVLIFLTGCIGLHLGGGKKTTTENRSETYNVTLGQQLLDLQKAYEAGAISKSEYDSQKRRLLKGR
jgi:hypothetical protein